MAIRVRMPYLVAAVGLLFIALVASACSGSPSPTPTPSLAATETPTPTAPPDQASPTPTGYALATPTPTSTPASTPLLQILSPQDGAGVEVGAVRVMGLTTPDAVVGVNGQPVPVNADGSFHADVTISEGANFIQVAASKPGGTSTTKTIAVFLTTPSAGLPFSLLYPSDGQEVSGPSVQVVGVTRPDAVVGVNGTPFEPNSLGIFAGTAPLVEGPNFIELVATDVQNNVRFETVSVFYVP